MLRYILVLPFAILAYPIAWILSPFLPMFCNKEGWLPHCLWWFQTLDNSLDGDEAWQKEHVQWLKNGSYFKRVLWLLRNPAYGFFWTALAYTPKDGFKITSEGDLTIKARDGAKAGSYTLRTDDGAFEKTIIKQIGSLPYCFKFRFGWILGDAVAGSPCLYLISIRIMGFRK